MKRNQQDITRGVLLIITVLVLLSGCRSAPVYNPKGISISPRPSASKEEIAEAIWSAGRRDGWQIEKVGEWKLKAVKRIRNHSATISIHYSKNTLDISYVDSDNLDFDGQNIHENYNVWIHRLTEKIQNEMRFRLPEHR